MSEQDDLLYIDDTQYINDITSKLAKIRETLGIEEDDTHIPQNTFGKNEDTQKELFSTPSKQQQSPQDQVENPSQLQNQISFLQNKLDALKQIYPQSPSVDNDQHLEKENTYLKLELELKTKQERYLKLQLQEVEEKLGLEIQLLRNELESVKQGHDNFVQSSDLQSDLKSYILSLETDLNMTRQELILYTQKLAEKEEQNEILQKEVQNIYNRVMKELDECYKKELNEMHYVCKSLSSELIKPENLKDKHEVQAKLQEQLDQNLLLEQKIEELESHQKMMKNGNQATLKTIYCRRLNNMKCGLLHWKTKCKKQYF